MKKFPISAVKILVTIVCLFITGIYSCNSPNGPQENTPASNLERLIRDGASLMWIGAHPDDETILAGVLWSFASADLGNDVFLVCFNRGDNGTCAQISIANGTCPCPKDEKQCPDTLGVVRSQEFFAVMQHFGAKGVILGWDNKYTSHYAQAAIDTVSALIRQHKPEVVVTHASQGGYGHPNHIAVNQVVNAVWDSLSESERPAYLYYALDKWPNGIDTEPVTDEIDGETFSQKLGKTYWEFTIEAGDLHATQAIGDRARNLPAGYKHANFFHLAR
jgi:LmbE family N-acetylglucosaminyl deacetylase